METLGEKAVRIRQARAILASQTPPRHTSQAKPGTEKGDIDLIKEAVEKAKEGLERLVLQAADETALDTPLKVEVLELKCDGRSGLRWEVVTGQPTYGELMAEPYREYVDYLRAEGLRPSHLSYRGQNLYVLMATIPDDPKADLGSGYRFRLHQPENPYYTLESEKGRL